MIFYRLANGHGSLIKILHDGLGNPHEPEDVHHNQSKWGQVATTELGCNG